MASAGNDEVGVAIAGLNGHPVPQPPGDGGSRSPHRWVAPQLGLAAQLDLGGVGRRLEVLSQI